MRFETLKKDNKKKIAIITIAVISITLVGIFATTFAKYKLTQSIPLVRGTINYKVPDMRVVAVNISEDGSTYTSTDDIPVSGYTFNATKSMCKVYNGTTSIEEAPKDENITIEYKDGKINFLGVSKNNTRCYLYFDKIRDTEKPVVSKIEATMVTKTSIAVKVTATDNTGVTKYYYSINGGPYIESTENTHTFSGLTKGTSYTISVKASDAAGNESEEKNLNIIAKEMETVNTILGNLLVNIDTPDFSKIADTDEGIFAADDSDGTTYYYRGAVTNNYLKFANKWWRIIRINGDGTIRIIYDGTAYHANGTKTTDSQIGTCAFNSSYNDNAYVGFMYGSTGQSTYAATHTNTNKSTILTTLETWYTNNLATYESKIDTNAGFCGDRSLNSGTGVKTAITYYGIANRFSSNMPSLLCKQKNDFYTVKEATSGNKALNYPIGLLNADEAILSGGVAGTANQSYYLYNGNLYWTLTPDNYECWPSGACGVSVYGVGETGYIGAPFTIFSNGVRPVINLRADVPITGSGTGDDPYVVN